MVQEYTTIGSVRCFSVSGRELTFEIDDHSKVRLGVLAADLVRVRVAPTGAFEPNVSRSVVKADWPTVPLGVVEDTNAVTLTTSAMKLVVRDPFILECRGLDGRLMLADDPARRIHWDRERTEVFKITQPGEKYLGLGWRPLGLVRNGSRFLMRHKPTYSEPETFNSGVPLWYGIHRGATYAVFFDDASWGAIDVGASSDQFMSFRNLGGNLDYYYFAGPTMAAVLDRFTELTGRPYLPPRWAIGYQQCRWSYTSQGQVLEIARELRARSVPCDVIYLDIDYMPGGHALTFDRNKFPDPAGMIADLHRQGFRVVANVGPILLGDDPKRPAAQSNDYLLKTADGAVHWGHHFYWAKFGGGKTGDVVWLDFSKTSARHWWADQHTPFLSTGIDGLWNDLNEPDELGGDWPANVKYDYDGRPMDHSKASTQYPLLQTELSCAILRKCYPDRRPFVISRGGCAGIQRYATLWTGDNIGDWTNDLKRNTPMGLSMSICGNPFNGHDIGGFFGHPTHDDPPCPELYARWMQAGVFSPFCRQHHDGFGNLADPPRPFAEPWRFGAQVEEICRHYIGLRYRLMPYLYTLFYEAHATGRPIQRPTLFDFPDDPRTLEQDYDFMFGPFMLVSPVTEPGVEHWATYLPAGAEWINWWDDSLHPGGSAAKTATPLDRLPIFIRGGAIIPLAPVCQYEGQTPIDVLTLELYPTGVASSFTLYEDDGLSWAYQEGGYTRTVLTMSGTGASFRLQIAARQGKYQPAPRHDVFKVHCWPDQTGTPRLNGQPLPPCADQRALETASEGWLLDHRNHILYARFEDRGADMVLDIA